MTGALYLFDDAVARGWEPLALTRPVAELLHGTLLQRERASRVLGIPCAGTLPGEALVGFREPGAPPALSAPSLPREGFRILLCSRVVPEGPLPLPLARWTRGATLLVEGEVVGWILPPGDPGPSAAELLRPNPRSGVEVELEGMVLRHPWELISGLPDRIARDLPLLHPAPKPAAPLPGGVHHLGGDTLVMANDVELEPGVVLDTRGGPIILSAGVRVAAFTRLEGPAWVGPGTRILGGVLTHVALGPVCRIRGEVEGSVVLGYSNKAHDGYLGHAYLGSWVNLGAMTTNSDLKNNYGPVRIPTGEGEVDTGLLKLGCLLGDHVKTGIGTLLNTGTVVGAGSNLFGGIMPPVRVPPFSWGAGDALVPYRLDRFLEVAERAMGRRGLSLPGEMRTLLARAWSASREETP